MGLKFDEKSYDEFLEKKREVENSPKRNVKKKTFWDAMVSKDADLRSTPEGRKLIKIIQNLGD